MGRIRILTIAIACALAALLQAPARGGLDERGHSKPQACPAEALGTARTLEIGAGGGLAIGLKTYPQTLDLADHEIVLTFDDGPWSGTTPAILDALAQQCVKATFFLIGRSAEAAPDLVKREVREGHSVGHHTFSHPGATLRGIGDAAARRDIERGFEADDIAAYGKADAEPKVPFFRFPGFADTPDLMAWLARRGVTVFGTDLWASDWLPMPPEAEFDLILSRLEAQKGGILLLHDTRRTTALILPELLRELKRRGFKIVHVVPGPARPALKKAPPGWTSETEAIIRHARPDLPAQAAAHMRDFTQAPPPAEPKPDMGTEDRKEDNVPAPVDDDPTGRP